MGDKEEDANAYTNILGLGSALWFKTNYMLYQLDISVLNYGLFRRENAILGWTVWGQKRPVIPFRKILLILLKMLGSAIADQRSSNQTSVETHVLQRRLGTVRRWSLQTELQCTLK